MRSDHTQGASTAPNSTLLKSISPCTRHTLQIILDGVFDSLKRANLGFEGNAFNIASNGVKWEYIIADGRQDYNLAYPHFFTPMESQIWIQWSRVCI